jgi:hypothetical protein
MKKNILVKLGLVVAGAYLLMSFKKKNTRRGGIPLINQLDVPTGTKQVYSKIGTRLFDLNKNTVKVFDYEGAGMTVTGFANGVYSVVYGLTFTNGLPAFVNATDVII